MGLWAKIFGTEEKPVSDAVIAARQRHGIAASEPEDVPVPEITKRGSRSDPDETDEYDPWEEVGNIRSSFFYGSWATRRIKWKPDHSGLEKDLAAAQRRREEKQQLKEEKKRAKGS